MALYCCFHANSSEPLRDQLRQLTRIEDSEELGESNQLRHFTRIIFKWGFFECPNICFVFYARRHDKSISEIPLIRFKSKEMVNHENAASDVEYVSILSLVAMIIVIKINSNAIRVFITVHL